MDTRAALLRAILDEPDDDAHRLVFADWLDDAGRGGWAALIRAQVALGKVAEPCADPYGDPRLLPLDGLTWHTRRDIAAETESLVGPVTSPSRPRMPCWKLRRGMVEYVEVLGEEGVRWFIGASARLFEQVPLADLVVRTSWASGGRSPVDPASVSQAAIEALVNLPGVGRLRNLDLRGVSMHGHFRLLAERKWERTTPRVWVSSRGYEDGHGYSIADNETMARLGERLLVRAAHPDNPPDELPF